MATRSGRLLLAATLAAGPLLAGCPDSTLPRLYANSGSPPAGLYCGSTPAMWNPADDGAPQPGDQVEVTEDLISSMQVLGAQLMTDAAGKFRGVNFSVYSQRAEAVRLQLFDDPESDRATQSFDMTRFGDVWNVYVEGVGLGQYYGFTAWGPNWRYCSGGDGMPDECAGQAWYPGSIFGFTADVDSAGNRFNPNKLLFDPYCKIFDRGHDWSKGSAGTGPDRAQSTFAAAMKCRVAQSSYVWSDHESDWRAGRQGDSLDGHHANDLILYEVHPKGFTANPSSGVVHYGTFQGFAEKEINDHYLSDLGVTAVELMPPFDKADDAGYWGYNTLGFFAPEHSYLWRNDEAQGIDEFKYLVDQLHQAGIEVILDVVYNHSGEGGLWRQKIYTTDDATPWNLDPTDTASLFGFRGLDNALYYALPPTDATQYCDYTGVGNTMRDNGAPMQRLTIDSLRYWVEEMHVDGYRFDLAPALGAADQQWSNCPTSQNPAGGGITWDPKSTMIQTVIDDPVLQKYNTRIIAEPWGAGGYPVGQFPATTNAAKPGYGWGEWNGRFRDWWRSFVNQDGWTLNTQQDGADGGYVIAGSQPMFQWNGRKPYDSVNFVTCHDGMTMYDLVSYDKKVNGCSPLNPQCCTDPLSSFCQEAENSGTDDNRSRNWSAGGACGSATCAFGQACYGGSCIDAELVKRQLMRNWFLAMMFSNGTPMVFGGDEWERTQLGNNNTYTPEADNAYSWHDWGAWQADDVRWRMKDFLKQAIQFRKDHAWALAPADYGGFAASFWCNPDGSAKGASDWGSRSLMIHFSGAGQKDFAILINMELADVTFTLPTGHSWGRLIDTQLYFDTPEYLASSGQALRASANATLQSPETEAATYSVKSRSIVVVEAR